MGNSLNIPTLPLAYGNVKYNIAAAVDGNIERLKHHTISAAAALLNWHRQVTGKNARMRPGIEPPSEAAS